MIRKVIYLDNDGIFSEVERGAILDISGTDSLTFTVGGRSLLYSDGSSTGDDLGITLQTIFNNSIHNGLVKLDLNHLNDFNIVSGNSSLFYINANTGKITINGDLEVLGNSTILETVVLDSDHWVITPNSQHTVALSIEPDFDIIPLADLVSIKKIHGGDSVVRVDKDGNVRLSEKLYIGGEQLKISDIEDNKNLIEQHLDSNGDKHTAEQISINVITDLLPASNTQTALEKIVYKLNEINNTIANFSGKGDVVIYEHVQGINSEIWNIVHNGGTYRVGVYVYNEMWEEIEPSLVKIISNNEVQVNFTGVQRGRAYCFLTNILGNVDVGNPTIAAPIGASNLYELKDVDITGIDTGKILKYDGNKWVISDISILLENIGNVEITDIQNNNILFYDSNLNKWVNKNIILGLASLEDVEITDVVEDQYLRYRNNKWVNQTIVDDFMVVFTL